MEDKTIPYGLLNRVSTPFPLINPPLVPPAKVVTTPKVESALILLFPESATKRTPSLEKARLRG